MVNKQKEGEGGGGFGFRERLQSRALGWGVGDTPTTGPNGLGCPEVLSGGVGWSKAEGSQEQPHRPNFSNPPERIRLLADCAGCACDPKQSCTLTHTRPMPRM